TVTVPRVGVSRAPMMFSSVVFPLPDGPRMTTNSAAPMCRVTASSAVTSRGSLPYCLVTCWRSIIARFLIHTARSTAVAHAQPNSYRVTLVLQDGLEGLQRRNTDAVVRG